MLGLMVFFFLGLWVVFTLIATFIGTKLGKHLPHKQGKLIGGFIGFMLLMGGWIVYWIGEYIYIQTKVSQLCKAEGGITVYITPEEWRKQIGEEEWSRLKEHDGSKKQYYPKGDLWLNGFQYFPTLSFNDRLVQYSSHEVLGSFLGKHTSIVLDLNNRQPLLQYTYFSAGSGNFLSGISGGYKFWLNDIYDCSDEMNQKFDLLIKLYSSPE